MKCFNGFCKDGVVQSSTVESILDMMGLRVQKEALDAIIAEVDEDGKKHFSFLNKTDCNLIRENTQKKTS